MGNEVGWNQLAVVFHLTKRAIEAAGSGGALAVHIKEMSLKYIEDRFAHWIVGQGGWVSLVILFALLNKCPTFQCYLC